MEVKYLDLQAQFKEQREETLKAITAVLEKGDFILGDAVAEFEKKFAALCGTKYAIGVANGTDSLVMALKALGVGPRDEVITTPNSFLASAAAINLLHAKPVFVDVGPDQNLDPGKLEAAITPRTKALMPVHLTGRCAKMTPIMEIAKKHGLPVVEDAAQSVGASVDGKKAGNWGTFGSFSLHPLKNLNAVGDAGVLTTNDENLYERMKLMRHHGLKNRDETVFFSYNSRLDTIQAAVLLVRMKYLDAVIESRRATAKKYIQGLADVVQCPFESDNERHTYHVFVIQCDRRNELQKYLMERGIDTKIHYPIPLHLQEAAQYLGYKEGDFPVAERQAQRILSLPIHQYLKEDQIAYVVDSVRKFYK